MADTSPNQGLNSLFGDLLKCEQSRDFLKALKVADKILKIENNNLKALQCKIISQMVSKKAFQESLDKINSNQELIETLTFEKAYCEYRLNRIEDCLSTLESLPELGLREKELKCQALYRIGRYRESYNAYLDLIKNTSDEWDNEREADLVAAVACLSFQEPNFVNNLDEFSDNSYELCFNKACIQLAMKNYQGALVMLNTAEQLCRKTLEEDDFTAEEIDSELAIIKGQLGYAYQMLGKNDLASKYYNQVLKMKSSDASLLAVISNNIVTINKDQNVFDSRKRMKQALSEIDDPKLSSFQKRSIVFNNCLLLMATNQGDSCRKQIQRFKSQFPSAEINAVILEAALLCKERRLAEAIEVLKRYRKKDPNNLNISLIASQLYLNQGHHGEALNVLKDLLPLYKVAIVSIIVAIHLILEDKDGAMLVLKDTMAWFQHNKPECRDLFAFSREAAKFFLQNNDPKSAVGLLEELRRHNPDNPQVLAQLIAAYSQIDPSKAKKIMDNLPPIESQISDIDVDALEASNWSLGAKYVKKTTKTDVVSGVKDDEEKEKKKKKKKKKKILPKNYDPEVDPNPERWLPRWQRSTYKKKKDKRAGTTIGKGTQGSTNEAEPIPKSAPKQVPLTANPSQNSRAQRIAQKRQKKKDRK